MRSQMIKTIAPYGFVVFLACFGFALPLPLIPKMFLNQEHSLLDVATSIEKRAFILGLFLSAYPLGQLIGSPFLGKLSDRFGRKAILKVTLLITVFGYLIASFAIWKTYLVMILLGLFICGICEGNIAIAQSVIADLSSDHKRSYQFGLIHFFGCLGFVIGPLFGGYLADLEIFHEFAFAVPFIGAAFLSFLGWVNITLFAQETKNEKSNADFSLWSTYTNPSLAKLYFSNFLIYLGVFFFFRFFPVFVERVFNFSPKLIGFVLFYDAVAIALGLLLLNKPLSKRFKPEFNLLVFSILAAVLSLLLIYPSYANAMWWTIPPMGLAVGIVMTYTSVTVSSYSPAALQGQALGCLVSIQVAAEILSGVIGGAVLWRNPALPLIIGSASLFLGATSLWLFRKSLNPMLKEKA